MKKILDIDRAVQIAKTLHAKKQSIVLAGGCFDILHIGHITFLEKAKEQADVLFVLLENDETIKKLKGQNRPINAQDDRGLILTYLSMVDYVVLLPPDFDDKNYDDLVIAIKPAIIATTKGDVSRIHKERQAEKIGAKVIDVTDEISNKSTTRVLEILGELL